MKRIASSVIAFAASFFVKKPSDSAWKCCSSPVVTYYSYYRSGKVVGVNEFCRACGSSRFIAAPAPGQTTNNNHCDYLLR